MATSRKAEILHKALDKDEEQLQKAQTYLAKEMNAAETAESKVQALPSIKEKKNVEEAVSTWRSALKSALANVGLGS